MTETTLNQFILMKEYITEEEYNEIHQLEILCNSTDKTNLKLELDYKLHAIRNSEIPSENINEFLYYIDDILVAYIGISSFGRNVAELNGMTHPNFRRKGIFKKLFELAVDQCSKRRFNKILLLSDGNSNEGIEFIKTTGAKYSFSEYRMKRLNKTTPESLNTVTLRKSDKNDRKEIAKQNAIFFNIPVEANGSLEEEVDIPKEITYMIQLKENIIGKIKVHYEDNYAFIFGFGILPDFRGRGYGKAALREALQLINDKAIYDIELDVECKNDTALNLYKFCGFEEKSLMNYYQI